MKSKELTIAHITDSYYPRTNGISICIDSLANYMAEKRNRVYIIAPEYSAKDERTLHKNIYVKRFKSYNLFFTTNKDERFIYFSEKRKIYNFLDEINPDIVHIHLEFVLGFFVRKWALKRNKPIVMQSHTYYPPYLKLYIPYFPMFGCKLLAKKYLKWFYKSSNLLLVSTKEIEDVLKNDYKIQKTMYRNFIGIDDYDFYNFNKKKDKEELLKEDTILRDKIKNKKVMLFVGRIGKEKNIKFLIMMAKKLSEIRKDFVLVLVGGGSYMNDYKNMAESLSVSDYTIFVDSVPHSKIRKYYALADIFTFASVTETQGVATTEALYLGLPVVAVSAFGTKTVLKDNKGGFLVNEDIDDFIEKVNLLFDNKKVYELKRKEALSRKEELSFARNFDKVFDIYKKLVK